MIQKLRRRLTALASLSNSYSVWLDEDGEVEEWTSDREDLYSDDQNAPKDMPSHIDTKKLLEDGVIDGGFGEKVARHFGTSDMKVLVRGVAKTFADRYDVEELLSANRLTVPQLVADVMALN